MRRLMVALGGALVLAAPVAQADVVGLGASVNYWNSDLTGNVRDGGDFVDVDNELNLDEDSSANAALYVEHPIPILPNVRLAYTQVEQSGQGVLTADFGGVNFSGINARSDLDLDQFDVTLYYEILDNWVNLDLGVTARDLSAELVVQDTVGAGLKNTTTIDGVIPMGYLAARFDLPFTGVSVGGEGNFIKFDGDSLRDFNVYGQYEISLLQLRAGYRQMAVDYEDGDDQLDVEMDGPFVSAGLSF
ncbi:TIGR04219 family outer membrane beta-barrel protein [Marinobacter salinexigens]|uniref:TIGR04219 family outer membrane beta-barrel protein n=1 Tax=Marinobacter salinexigens TaxID=2919747 RepID=A0A5B0VM60_9GAMM|nr:TIGR04219 family outer membrane beta-barrel protein [Marinobacter salinexigens]KAA1175019.1 TIGR04219 family outer membrane beta-barrel protein [Marinobacter salinexigens]